MKKSCVKAPDTTKNPSWHCSSDHVKTYRTNHIFGPTLLPSCSLPKKIADHSHSVERVTNELPAGLSDAELKPISKESSQFRLEGATNMAIRSGFRTFHLNTDELHYSKRKKSPGNVEEDEARGRVEAMAGALNQVTLKMQNIVKNMRQEEDGLHDEIKSFIKGAKTTLATVRKNVSP